MRFRYAPPQNEKDFELVCLAVLQREWRCPTLELYAHRGEAQHGIDIVDITARRPLRVAQCKLVDVGGTLTLAQVRDEVRKAKLFPQKIDFYLVLTTGKRSKKTQDALLAINQDHRARRLFEVQVVGWDWIEDVLDRWPDLADRLRIPGAAAAGASARDESLSTLREVRDGVGELLRRVDPGERRTGAPAEIDGALDSAKLLLDRGQYQGARAVLVQLEANRWHELSPHQRMRLKTNLAISHMDDGDPALVARLLEEGAAFEPESERAAINTTVALEFRGCRAKANEAAAAARRAFPQSVGATAAWVRTAPADVPFAAIAGAVDAIQRNDPHVALAMSMRALAEGACSEAELCARRAAAQPSPKRGYAMVVEGRAVMEGQLAASLGTRNGQPVLADTSAALRAVELFTGALAVEDQSVSVLGEALACRADVYMILGEEELARKDIERARTTAPRTPDVQVAVAELLLRDGRWDAAAEAAQAAVDARGGARARFLLARSLWFRGAAGDRVAAVAIFRELALESRSTLQVEATEHLLKGLIALDSVDEGWRALDLLSDRLAPHLGTVMRATYALWVDARAEADRAVEQLLAVVAELTWDVRRRLAHILLGLGRDDQALPVLRSLVSPGRLTDEVHHLLSCAYRLGRHAEVLRLSKELREAGVRDSLLLNNEIVLLAQYAPNEAIGVLADVVRSDPDDLEARLTLAVLGLRMGRDDLVPKDTGWIPDPHSVAPKMARAVVDVLLHWGHWESAVEFAYEVLRRNFGDPRAHRAYLAAWLWRKDRPASGGSQVVTLDTAVQYRDLVTSVVGWVVFEERPIDASELNEIDPQSPRAAALMGHVVGDRVVVAKGHAQDRVFEVVSVVDKRRYRLSDCVDMFQVRFPREEGIEVIKLASTADGTIVLDPIASMLEARREGIARIEDFAQQHFVPLHVLSERCRRGLVETFHYVVENPALSLRCSPGDARDFDEGLLGVRSAQAVVLDTTALLTMGWLDVCAAVSRWSIKFVVAHGVQEILRRRLEELRRDGPAGAMMSPAAGVVHALPAAPREHADQVARMATLAAFVEQRCTVADCPELAELDSSEREETFLPLVGEAGSQSVLVAGRPGHLLWTDDAAAAVLARDRGIPFACTQVIVHARHAAGELSNEEVARIDAMLLGARFEPTRFDTSVVVAAGESAGWDPRRWPLSSVLDALVPRDPRFREGVLFLVGAVVTLSRHVAMPTARDGVLVSLADRVAQQPRGLEAIRAVLQILPQAFGLDVVRGREAVRVIQAFLATR